MIQERLNERRGTPVALLRKYVEKEIAAEATKKMMISERNLKLENIKKGIAPPRASWQAFVETHLQEVCWDDLLPEQQWLTPRGIVNEYNYLQ